MAASTRSSWTTKSRASRSAKTKPLARHALRARKGYRSLVVRDREPWQDEWHDYYAVLGIPDYQVRSASSQIIERLFRTRVQVVHPGRPLPPGATNTIVAWRRRTSKSS